MEKRELRKLVKKTLTGLPDEYFELASAKIAQRVIASEDFKAAQTVFIYVSTAKEPSTRAVLEAAWESGKAVYVPKCCAGNLMKAVRVRSFADLVPGMMDILEPADDSETVSPDKIEYALVPCVAAGAGGARLGHGGGYYDRFLAGQSMKKVCICFEKLILPDIPMDEFDNYMDAVVTEERTIEV